MFHRPGYIFTDKNKGAAPMQYGSVILLSMVFSIVGMVLGILAMLEKDIFRMFPVLGIVLNSLTLIAGCMILYIGVR